jgi:glc operon protein GlcG
MVQPPVVTRGLEDNHPGEELMRSFLVACSIAAAVFTTAAQAEMAAPAPAPVPDQMPWDVPYGESITLVKAQAAIAAAIAEASKSPRNWKLSVAVVDPHGELVALHKMDQTQIGSVGISIGKARTAARYRRPSEVFAALAATPAGGFLATLSDPPPVASPGGIPLIENGKIIGAIGCSGATGPQDAVACKAGAETIK